MLGAERLEHRLGLEPFTHGWGVHPDERTRGIALGGGHAASRCAKPRRPSSPRATFLSNRAISGAARVATWTLSRYRNEGRGGA